MRLDATISATTLIDLVRSLMPLRIELGGDTGSERRLTLSEPQQIELIAGRGLSLACRANVVWPVLGMRFASPIRSISVILEPRVAQRAGRLALIFGLHIERADLAGLPPALESRILEWVNQALREREIALAWKVADTFDRSFALPAMLSGIASFDLALERAEVAVTAEALTLSFGVAPGITRAVPTAP